MLVYLGSLHTCAHDKIHFLFLAGRIIVQLVFLFLIQLQQQEPHLFVSIPIYHTLICTFPSCKEAYIRLQSLRAVACVDFKIKSNNTINGCGLLVQSSGPVQ